MSGCRQLEDGDWRILEQLIHEEPWNYLDEFQHKLRIRTGYRYTRWSIRHAFHANGYTWTKLERIARARSAIEERLFWSKVNTYDHECLLFLDESHVDDRDSRRVQGWSKRGLSCIIRETFQRGKPVSVLAAFNTDGFVLPACWVEKSKGVNREIFLKWVRNRLLPVLQCWSPHERRKNSVVVLDNAGVHHSDEFLNLIYSRGALVVYTAPLCPHLNPIELGFGNMKRILKRMNMKQFPVTCLFKAMESVTPKSARGFFRKCGYQVMSYEEAEAMNETQRLLPLLLYQQRQIMVQQQMQFSMLVKLRMKQLGIL